MKKVKFIYNLIAGQSKFLPHIEEAIAKLRENDIEVSLLLPKEENDLEEFLKKSDSESIYAIIVAGGDGTINKVVNIMMKYNIKTPLGIIPAGTSNDFARHINMPKSYIDSLEKILNSNVRGVDVGKANDYYFINECSAGLFTNSSQRVDKKLKNKIGKLSYFITGAKELFKFRPFTVNIKVDNEEFTEKINLFLVFNGSSVGGMTYLTQNSSIYDGLLDLIVIKNCSIHEVCGIVAKVIAGHNLNDKNIIYRKAKKITIEKIKGNCDRPDVDGDEGPQFPLEIECIENGINMFV